MKERNPIARELAERKYRQRIVSSKKGRGSYSRKERNVQEPRS